MSKPTIESLQIDEFVSPYKLAKLESTLRGKTIPPQKLYGYVRNGYVKVSLNTTKKLQITRDEAIKYLTRFV